jgi:hypothetical protein
LLFFIAILIVQSGQQQKLDDPENTEVVSLDKIVSISLLAMDGEYLLRTYRQSGNLQQDDRLFSDYESAIKAAVSTFKRAKIDSVVIDSNCSTELVFRRLNYCHRGSSEGKKVGSVSISKVT